MEGSTTADGHAVETRHLERREHGGWAGRLVCSCGWSVDVGPFRTSYIVSDVMAERWLDHMHEGTSE
jgi:hypothetical protein